MITIQNQLPIYCELLEEIEIDTEDYYKNVSLPTRTASQIINAASQLNLEAIQAKKAE